MRIGILLATVLSVVMSVSAATFSSNTFALYEVDSALQSTIVAVPVSGYGADGELSDARINSLVCPHGLTEGDMLLAVTSGVSYAAWELKPVAGSTTGAMEWRPIATAQRVDSGTRSSIIAENDGTGTIARGQGLMLIRKNPGTRDNKGKFSLFGLWKGGETTVTIRGGSSSAPTYTMLADPVAREPLNLNALAWPAARIGANDTLVLTSESSASRVYLWDAKKNSWYYAKTAIANGMITTEYVYNLDPVPPGTGFWYVRRTEGDFTLTFPSDN